MKVKLYSRNPIIINLVFFVVLSYVFVHVLESLKLGISAIDGARMYASVLDSPFYTAFAVIMIFMVWKASRLTFYIFPAFCFCTLYESFLMFFSHFDKMILALIFFYLLIAFYFYVLWMLELNSAAYCPNYKVNEIEQKALLSIYTEIIDESGNNYSGYLTNWDDSSCFVLFDCDYFPGRLNSKIEVKINFANNVFSQTGKIVTGYGAGVGIEFAKAKVSRFDMGWKHFYSIIMDRGYLPQG